MAKQNPKHMAGNIPSDWGWEVRESRSHGSRVYYRNPLTGESQWDVPSGPIQGVPTEVRASHILAKHTGSRRPSSWRENVITRTLPEAEARINEFKSQLDRGEVDFATIARRESDCSSATKGGDLGFFGRGQMQKPFEDTAYSLKVGEMLAPVFTESGVHIILRTG